MRREAAAPVVLGGDPGGVTILDERALRRHLREHGIVRPGPRQAGGLAFEVDAPEVLAEKPDELGRQGDLLTLVVLVDVAGPQHVRMLVVEDQVPSLPAGGLIEPARRREQAQPVQGAVPLAAAIGLVADPGSQDDSAGLIDGGGPGTIAPIVVRPLGALERVRREPPALGQVP
ncbi:MAG: hypothetical protein ACKVW3_12895 [Phycisphaerales bacterium]